MHHMPHAKALSMLEFFLLMFFFVFSFFFVSSAFQPIDSRLMMQFFDKIKISFGPYNRTDPLK